MNSNYYKKSGINFRLAFGLNEIFRALYIPSSMHSCWGWDGLVQFTLSALDTSGHTPPSGRIANYVCIIFNIRLQLIQLKIFGSFFQQKGCGPTFLFHKRYSIQNFKKFGRVDFFKNGLECRQAIFLGTINIIISNFYCSIVIVKRRSDRSPFLKKLFHFFTIY